MEILMIKLLNEKSESVNALKSYTKEILLLSPKTDDEKINIMVAERQMYIEKIDLINIEIDNYIKSNEGTYKETNEIKIIKNTIKDTIQEIINMDKKIRKKVNEELKTVKMKLRQPDTVSKLVNIKI